MEQTRRKKLLTRVSKLLAQAAATPYAAEAETALALAQKVLLENGLSMAEVDALSAQEQATLVANESVDEMGRGIIDWRWRLAYTVAQALRCEVYVQYVRTQDGGATKQSGSKSLRFVGLTEDVLVARDVYHCARDVAQRLSHHYIQEHRGVHVAAHLYEKFGHANMDQYPPVCKAAASREVRLAWLGGFVMGLDSRFKQQMRDNPSLALMLQVHPVVRTAMASIGARPTGYTSKVSYEANRAARVAGFQVGKNFDHQQPGQRPELRARLPGGHG